MKRIVIWGDDHHNALGLLRMLGGRGFEILFMVHGTIYNIATASRYCTKYVLVKSLEEGLDYLLCNYNDNKNKAVLFFTADRYSEFANINLNKLRDYFYVTGPNQINALPEIDDKYTMGELASKCGITIPKTVLLPSDEMEPITHFPVIIKPCDPANKGFKTIIISSVKKWNKVKKSLVPGKRYVIQEYINKKADGLIYGCRTWDGQTHLAGICVRNRWGDDKCGSFGYITPDIPESVSVSGIKQFLDIIDFRGLFSVEYALTQSGEAYFYEFNLRNDGTSVLFYNAGSNLALAFVNSCYGIKEEIPLKVSSKQFLMHEILDRFNIYDGNVSKKQWLEDKEKVTLHFLLDPDDMKPYELQKKQETWLFIHHIISRTWINKLRLYIKNRFKS